MNKSDLIAAVAAKTGETKKNAEASINAVIDVIAETLAKGDKIDFVVQKATELGVSRIVLFGFGSFEVRSRAARKGRNPQTGKEMKIAAKKAPVFKAGKALKDAVNG